MGKRRFLRARFYHGFKIRFCTHFAAYSGMLYAGIIVEECLSQTLLCGLYRKNFPDHRGVFLLKKVRCKNEDNLNNRLKGG